MTTTISTDLIYTYKPQDKQPRKLHPYTEVFIVRGYGSFEQATYHTRTWLLHIPFKITNQSRVEAIGARRQRPARVIHL